MVRRTGASGTHASRQSRSRQAGGSIHSIKAEAIEGLTVNYSGRTTDLIDQVLCPDPVADPAVKFALPEHASTNGEAAEDALAEATVMN
ncbi:MAG: hypothetical protein AAF809_12960 [Bacteroidota bacterium]